MKLEKNFFFNVPGILACSFSRKYVSSSFTILLVWAALSISLTQFLSIERSLLYHTQRVSSRLWCYLSPVKQTADRI